MQDKHLDCEKEVTETKLMLKHFDVNKCVDGRRDMNLVKLVNGLFEVTIIILITSLALQLEGQQNDEENS